MISVGPLSIRVLSAPSAIVRRSSQRQLLVVCACPPCAALTLSRPHAASQHDASFFTSLQIVPILTPPHLLAPCVCRTFCVAVRTKERIFTQIQDARSHSMYDRGCHSLYRRGGVLASLLFLLSRAPDTRVGICSAFLLAPPYLPCDCR